MRLSPPKLAERSMFHTVETLRNNVLQVGDLFVRKMILASLAVLTISFHGTVGFAAGPAPTLSLGARGVDVALVQRLLAVHGEPVEVTALMGPTTQGLIKRFQARAGLVADGVVGAQTWARLHPTLRQGDWGGAVTALQIALNDKHSYGLAPDGLFGPRTSEAVRAFQRHMGLSADGVVGPQTWGALIGHYQPLERSTNTWYRYGTSNSTGNFGTAHMIATFKEVARQWRQISPDVRIGVGDLSLPHGGWMPGHQSHQQGVDMDIRVFRKDGAELPMGYKSPGYSRALTQQMVDLLLETGEVELILFNDPQVRGVTYWPNHDSHLHVRFKR